MEISAQFLQLTFQEFTDAVKKMRKAQEDFQGSPTNYNRKLKELKEAKVDGYIADIEKNGGLQVPRPENPLQLNILLK